MTSERLPKFSIITVVLNREEDIEYTLNSIAQQTYSNIQYIVIDGGSTDETLDKIESYKDKIDILVSEKDHGIYDAMNKGLKLAQGDYVLFLNGGDSLHEFATLEKVVQETIISKDHLPDIIYGECLFVNNDRTPISTRSKFKKQTFPKTLNEYSFKKGTNVSHQAFIVKNEIAGPYDLSYSWCSDIDWMLNCIKKSKYIRPYNGIIAEFVLGGTSESQKLASLKERFLIMQKHYGFFKNIGFHTLILINKLQNYLHTNKYFSI